MTRPDIEPRTQATPPSTAAASDAAPHGDARVVPGLVAVLAILPLLMLLLMMPVAFAMHRDGVLGDLQLAGIFAFMALLPAGIVLMLLRRRGAMAAYLLAVLACGPALAGPLARLLVAGALVALIGACASWAQARTRSRASREATATGQASEAKASGG